jgi:hypothetical protein
VPDAGCGLRREQVAAGGLEEFQHLRAGHGLFELLASLSGTQHCAGSDQPDTARAAAFLDEESR